MKRKFLALLCVAALVLSLASCTVLEQLMGEQPNNDTCEHTYSDSWSSDAAEHWHAASCDHAELKTDVASHADANEDGKCDVCDYTMTPAHEHNFVDGSCECGETDPNYVPPHTHNFVDGVCECGETDPNYVPPHTHNFVDGVCECGETDPDYVPHEHFYVAGVCECGAEDPDYVACEHEYEVPYYHPQMQEATCATPGVAVYQCALCNDIKIEETPLNPDNHEWDWANPEVIVAADCATMTDGINKYHCTGCEATKETESYAFHDMLEDYVPATCTENGSYSGLCTVCGYEESYVIEAQGHYNYYITCGESGNCLECGIEITKEHDYTEATCTNPSFCVNCWTPNGEALGHNFVDGICQNCEEPDYDYSSTIEIPETPDMGFMAGVWYGEETGSADEGYEGYHTFVLNIDANGKGTGMHSLRGEFNVTYVSIKPDHVQIGTNIGTLYLVYNEGTFTLRGEQSFDYSLTKGDFLAMFKIAGLPTPPAHEHNYVDGKCECGESDPNYVVTAPAEITREYLAGTWYGTETGAFDYAGDHTFVVIIDDNGKTGVVKHSALGEFRITGITIMDGNSVMMDLTIDTYMISLEYNNGVFTLADGKNFTYGREYFSMSKTEPAPPAHEHNYVDGKCECGESDPNYVEPAPEFLTYDYLAGTWYGTESGSAWCECDGNHTFTIEFDEYGMGTVNHSELGTFDVIVEISYGMIYAYPECEFGMTVWMYDAGVIFLFDGMDNFTGGDVLSMTKA